MFLWGPNSGDMEHFKFLFFSPPTSICSSHFPSISHRDYGFACEAVFSQPGSFLFIPKCCAKAPSQCQLGNQSLHSGRECSSPQVLAVKSNSRGADMGPVARNVDNDWRTPVLGHCFTCHFLMRMSVFLRLGPRYFLSSPFLLLSSSALLEYLLEFRDEHCNLSTPLYGFQWQVELKVPCIFLSPLF